MLLQSKWWVDVFVLRLCVYACGCAWALHTTRKHDALIRLLCRYKMSNRLINWDTWCTVYLVSELASLFCWWNYSDWKRVLHFCCFFFLAISIKCFFMAQHLFCSHNNQYSNEIFVWTFDLIQTDSINRSMNYEYYRHFELNGMVSHKMTNLLT